MSAAPSLPGWRKSLHEVLAECGRLERKWLSAETVDGSAGALLERQSRLSRVRIRKPRRRKPSKVALQTSVVIQTASRRV